MLKKIKCIAASAAVLLTATFAGMQVSAEEDIYTVTGNLLQDGYLYDTTYDVERTLYNAGVNTSLEKELVAACESYQTYLSVSKYNLSKDDFFVQYWGILNEHPELFFVANTASYSTSGGVVSRVTIKYDYTKDVADPMRAALAAEIDKVLAGVDPNWTDAEKALYLHEYLTQHVAYTYSYYDMYELLVNGRGVCQAYAITNKYLLNKLGIECKTVTSKALNHAWNLLEIDGKWYYTDVTWDDPYPNIEGYSGHRNLLRSKEGLISTGHDSTDWVWVGSNVYDTTTDTKYDSWFWSDTKEPVDDYCEGKWFFNSDTGIDCFDFRTESSEEFYTYDTNQRWYLEGKNSWYVGYYTGYGFYDNRVLFNTPKALYSIDVTGISGSEFTVTPVLEYTLDSSTDSIYDFTCDSNGLVTLKVMGSWDDDTIIYEKVQLTEKSHLAITSQPVDYTGKIGDTAKFTVEAEGAKAYQWYQNTGSGWVAMNTAAGRSKSISIPVVAFRVGFQYKCVVSDGTDTITSDVVSIKLDEILAITTQPVDFVGNIGDTAKFTVEATGATSYQWYQNTGSGWVAMNTTAGRSKSISIAVAQFRVGFQYKCEISDGTNTLTSNIVSIKLDEVLGIKTQPTDYVGAIGDTAKFTIGATGVKYYQWQQNTGSGWVNINTSAGRSNAISIAVAQFRVGYQYRCMISDGTTLIASDVVAIRLEGETLAITGQPVDFVGTIGGNATFTVTATGATSYQWYQNTGSGWVAINTAAGRSKTITIPVAAFRVGFQYRCEVSDGTNTITSDVAEILI